MGFTIKKIIPIYIFIFLIGCKATKENIIICNQKYDVYSQKAFLYEENMNAVFNTICFPKSHYYLFSYIASANGKDTNLVTTSINYKNDSLIVTTIYDKSIYGYDYVSVRYYRCLPNAVISLSPDSKSEFLITLDTARKYNMKLTRKEK